MNRFERSFSGGTPAKLRYRDADYDVLSPGSFVNCAVTGEPIPLEDLRYWSVDLQEPYSSPANSLLRYREINKV